MTPFSRRRLLHALGTGAGVALIGSRRGRAIGREAESAARAAIESGHVPEAVEIAPDPNDPIAILYGRRLAFADGMPQITVRILEGQESFTFVPHGRVRISWRGVTVQERESSRAGRWRVRVTRSTPGRATVRVHVGEHLFDDAAGAEAEAQLFRIHGYRVSLVSVGSVYGIAGRTVDTRHVLVLIDGDGTQASAEQLASDLTTRFALRPQLHQEPTERGHGTIEVFDPSGRCVASGPDALAFEVDGGVTVQQVEHSVGYPDHGFEDRRYDRRFFAAVDFRGLLAAVSLVPLEDLTKGIVPSEIFAQAHKEALKAQAVTARGEILAKVGARHIGDPYLLCAEQHCQVFRGISGERPRSSAAVDATRGEALFAAKGGPLVPSYYSAICGGHTEDNDKVWGGPPNPSIRGRPDFPVLPEYEQFAGTISEDILRRWLEADVPSYCRTASVAKRDKYRWTRTFTQADVDAITAPFGIGTVAGLEVDGRGASGRARTLILHGSNGLARVQTELSIRRLFQMLPSGMFLIDAEGDGAARTYTFRGGGWGHGAGMCQTGAIGRAEQGATYREILGVYFSGADVVRMYG